MRIFFASLMLLFGTVANGQDSERWECILLIPDVSFSRDFCDFCGCCITSPNPLDINFPEDSLQDLLERLQQRQSPGFDPYSVNILRLNGICSFNGFSINFSKR